MVVCDGHGEGADVPRAGADPAPRLALFTERGSRTSSDAGRTAPVSPADPLTVARRVASSLNRGKLGPIGRERGATRPPSPCPVGRRARTGFD